MLECIQKILKRGHRRRPKYSNKHPYKQFNPSYLKSQYDPIKGYISDNLTRYLKKKITKTKRGKLPQGKLIVR